MRYPINVALVLCLSACGPATTDSEVTSDAAAVSDAADGALCPPEPPEYAWAGGLPPTWCRHHAQCPPVVGPGGETLGSLRGRGCVYVCPVGWQTCGDSGVCGMPWREPCPR